jgi:hypothetical protein
MASKTKPTPTTKKPTPKAKRAAHSTTPKKEEIATKQSREEIFDARKLLAIPLVCLAACCIYLTIMTMGGFSQVFQDPSALLIFPPFVPLFIAVFSSLAAYMLIKGKPIGKFATAVAWIFTIVSVWVAGMWLYYSNPGYTPGASDNGYQIYIFLNPFSLGLYSLLAIVGIVIMTKRLKKQR